MRMILGILVAAVVAFLVALCSRDTQAQRVPCRYVPNGAAITIACANGYWVTTMPDGSVVEGMGMTDPNADVSGSGIVINPATGGPAVGAGPTVTPPTQVVPTPAPGQSYWYGLPVPQE